MPSIRLEAQADGDELLRAVEQLSPVDFQRFAAEFLAMRARKEAPVVTDTEATLLVRIGRPLPVDLKARVDELIARRRDESLSPEEHAQLLQLGEEVEAREADRLAALADLARLRGVTLPTLMSDLGIPAAAHD